MRRLVRWTICLLVFMWFWTSWPVIKGALCAPVHCAEGVAATIEMSQLRKLIVGFRTVNGHFPGLAELNRLIADNYGPSSFNPTLDSWGEPYYYELLSKGFVLTSGGPDRKMGTRDDLTMRYEER